MRFEPTFVTETMTMPRLSTAVLCVEDAEVLYVPPFPLSNHQDRARHGLCRANYELEYRRLWESNLNAGSEIMAGVISRITIDKKGILNTSLNP